MKIFSAFNSIFKILLLLIPLFSFAQEIKEKIPLLIHKDYVKTVSTISGIPESNLLEHEVNDGLIYLRLDDEEISKFQRNGLKYEILKSVELEPNGIESSPYISSITYSGNLYVGEEITFYVEGTNTGTSSTDDGYITMSFPQFSNVNSFGKNLLLDDVNKYTAGYYPTYTCDLGEISASYVFIDGHESGWSSNESHEIWAKVTAYQTGYLNVYAKMSIGEVRYPSGSCTGPDQQRWPITLGRVTIQSPPQPDLIIQDIVISPTSPVVGETVTITATVKNQGNANASPFYIAYYVDNVYIGEDVLSFGLNAGNTNEESINYTATVSGTHAIKVVADYNYQISESDEGNNIRIENFTWVLPKPDLIITSVSLSSTTVQAGNTVDVSYTIKNQGNATANASTSGLYLSTTQYGMDTYLGNDGVTSISAGSSVNRTKTVTIPAGTSAGSYYLVVSADYNGQISESNEGNNNNSRSVSIIKFTVTTVTTSITPTTVNEGDLITISTDISGTGSGTVTFQREWKYPNSSTWQPTGLTHTVTMTNGSTTVPDFQINASAGGSDGGLVCFRVVVISPNSRTSNESCITVNVPKPDLIITSVSLSSTTVQAGNTVDVSYTIKNQGNATANASTSGLYLSTTQYGMDTYLGNDGVSSIGVGSSVNRTKTVTIPTSTEDGFYYLVVSADYNGQIDEGNNEGNNNNSQVFYVSPNSMITLTEPSSNIKVSQSEFLNISWTGSPSISTVTLIRDIDSQPENGNEYVIIENQPASGSYNWNTANVPVGTYYLYAKLDNGIDHIYSPTSPSVKIIPPADGLTKYYALVLGSADGDPNGLFQANDEEVCVNDVNNVKNTLLTFGGNWSSGNISTLVNNELDQNQLELKMATIGDQIDGDDVFLFYYTGHGSHLGLALTSGENFTPYEMNNVLNENIVQSAKSIIILNACYSGIFPIYFSNLLRDNIYIISSSEEDEATPIFSWILGHPWSHSLFNYHFCAAIDGGADNNDDFVVTTGEAFDYIGWRVILGSIGFAHPQEYYSNNLNNLAITMEMGPNETIPTLVLNNPNIDLTYTAGELVIVSWGDSDSDDNAIISLARDIDDVNEPWATGTHDWLSSDALTIEEDPDGVYDQYQWNTSDTPPGTYVIWGMINDSYHSPRYSRAIGKITILAGSQSPSISITSPTSGQTFTDPNITVMGTSDDPTENVTQVEVKLNNGNWNTASGTTSWSYPITLISGSNTIYARSKDDQGTYSEEVSVIVTYTPPNQNPQIAITSPTPGQTFTDPNITVLGTSNDPTESVTQVEVKLNNGNWNTASGTTSWSYPITLISGSNTIYARSKDDQGAYSGEVSVTVTYTPPNQNPQIAITSPTPGQTFTDPNITVLGTSNDPTESVMQVEVKLNNGNWNIATGTTSWSYPVTLVSGSNTIYARSRDDQGAYSNEVSVTVSYNSTNQLPTVVITSPIDQQEFQTNQITVSGTAQDLDLPVNLSKVIETKLNGIENVFTVKVRVNSGDWIVATGTTNWSADVSLQTGDNLIEAMATDDLSANSDIVSVNVSCYPNVTISGYIKLTDNTPIEGVLIDFENATSCTTNATGYYEIILPYEYIGYTTLSYLPGWDFNPVSRTYTDVINNLTNENYVAIPPQSSGLIAHYNFNGNANDESGNLNNPSAVNEISYNVQHIGLSAQLTPTSYIQVEDNSTFDFSGSSGVSIATWIRQEQSITGGEILRKMGTDGPIDDEYGLWISPTGNVQGAFNSPAQTNDQITSVSALSLDTWYHIVLMYDQLENKIKLFINGTLDNSIDATIGSVQNTNAPLRIGQWLQSYMPSFTGSIDETRIYNRVLSTQEITDLFNEGGWPLNNPPELTWTGEPGYETDGVDPVTGQPNTSFTFRVKYIDVDGDAPETGHPTLGIWKGGVEIQNSPFTMTEVNSDPFESGRIYSFSINNLAPGTDYTYKFGAWDSEGNYAVGEATIEQNGPYVINLSNDAVAYYSFTEMGGSILLDQSGNSNSGEVNGATWQSESGLRGLQFNGTDNYVTVPHSNSFNFGTGDFTIEVQFKTSSVPTTSWSALVSKHNNTTSHDKEIFVGILGGNGYPFISLSDGYGSFENAIGTSSICDGLYHTLRGVRKNNTLYLYIDGKLESSISASINPDNINPINIGRSSYNNGYGYFDGIISKVIFWDYAITNEVAHYSFIEMSGTTLEDHSGNENNGLITAANWQSENGLRSLLFDGSGSYVSIPDNTLFDMGTDEFSIEVQFKTSVIPGGSWVQLFSKHNTAMNHDKDIEMFIEGGTGLPVFRLSDGTGYFETAKGSSIVTDGNYHTVRGLRRNNQINIYVDGNLESTVPASINPDNDNPVNIGRSSYGGGAGYFDGVITKVSVWKPSDMNSSPQLSWTGDTGYESDGVDPNEGNTSSQFTFKVKYTDADEDAPLTGYPKVHIKKGGVEITNSPFTMTEVVVEGPAKSISKSTLIEEGTTLIEKQPDSENPLLEGFLEGVVYQYQISGLEAGDDYTYYFEAYDVNGNPATGEATVEQSGPVVNEEMPTITLTQPSSNIIVTQGDSVGIEWYTTNPLGQTVALYTDLDNIYGNGNENPIDFFLPLNGIHYWNTAEVQSGTYYIFGIVPDGASNPYNYAEGTVTINPVNQLPIISISYPTDGLIVSDANIDVQGTAQDPTETVTQVQVKLNNGNWELVSGTTNWTHPVTLTDGVNTICARALDDEGAYSQEVCVTVTYFALPEHWTNLNPVPQGNTLRSVFFINNSTGWMAGTGGLILKTTNTGEEWIQQITNTGIALKAIYFVDEFNGWAVGELGIILYTNNGGNTWIQQSSNVSANLNAVKFFNSSTGWAVGYNGTILKTTNGGVDWMSQSSGVTTALFDIDFYDANYLIAVGGNPGGFFDPSTILKTTNGGTNWINKNDPPTIGELIYAVEIINNNIVWASGEFFSLKKSTDSGETWNVVSEGIKDKRERIPMELIDGFGGFRDIFFKDNNYGYLAGGENEYSRQIKITTDGGNNWSTKSFGMEEYDLFSINVSQEGKGISVGGAGTIYHSFDNGNSWIQQFSGAGYASGDDIESLQMINHDIGFAVGRRSDFIDAGGIVLKTVNGGKTWLTNLYQAHSGDPLMDLFFVDDNVGWIVQPYAAGKTTDGGNTWNWVSSGIEDYDLNSIYFFDPNIGCLTSNSGVYISTDGGLNWVKKNPLPSMSPYLLNSNTGFVASTNGVHKTTDGGNTWIQKSTVSCNSVFFINNNIGWFAGSNGNIYKTTDGGESWIGKTSGTSKNLNKIHFADINKGLAGGADGTLLISADGGETWEDVSTGTTKSFNTVHYYNSATAWAAGDDGLMLKYYDNIIEVYLSVDVKILLEGCYNNNSTQHIIALNNNIPINQPYDTSPWNYQGLESVTEIPAGVVDWVLVELRNGLTSDTKVISRAGFLMSDGTITDLDGISPLRFSGIGTGEYYTVVYHRNHLAIMSANSLSFNEGQLTSYDFTDNLTKAYGSSPMKELGGGKYGMYSGDGDADGNVDYGNDVLIHWLPNFGLDGYHGADYNMNGSVDYGDDLLEKWLPNFGYTTQVPGETLITKPKLNQEEIDKEIKILMDYFYKTKSQ